MISKWIEWFYMTVCAYPRTWILSSFTGGFAVGYFYEKFAVSSWLWIWKSLTLVVALFLLWPSGGGNAFAGPYDLTEDGRYFTLSSHQERGKDGLTNINNEFCNDGAEIVKRDYDLDGNGVDDYTTYTAKGEDHPFAELVGNADGYFDHALVLGQRFKTMGHLKSKYPTVCEALRRREQG